MNATTDPPLERLYREEEESPHTTHNKRSKELQSKVKPYLRSA